MPCGGLVGGVEAPCGGLVGGVETPCGGLVGGVEAPCGALVGGVCRCSVSTCSDPRLLVLVPDSSSDTVGVDVLEFSEWSLVDGTPTPGMEILDRQKVHVLIKKKNNNKYESAHDQLSKTLFVTKVENN